MFTSLHLKIAVVLGYVALCTMLVLAMHQPEFPTDAPLPGAGVDYE